MKAYYGDPKNGQMTNFVRGALKCGQNKLGVLKIFAHAKRFFAPVMERSAGWSLTPLA